MTALHEQPKTSEPAVGLECRACGCRHFRVVDVSPQRGGYIRRRRECRHCGKRLTTSERIVG